MRKYPAGNNMFKVDNKDNRIGSMVPFSCL